MKFTLILIIILIFLASTSFFKTTKIDIQTEIAPTPYQFPYKNPSINKNRSYRIVIVGDSIVNALGLNANVLRLNLIKYYPNSEFVTYNYGYPSTNVLSLYKRLEEEVLKQGFDLIIIESFGYNPLSDYPIEEGLRKQTEELEKSVRLVLDKKPEASLAFMTPIALDPLTYAKSTRDITDEVRKSWVSERVEYIKNHRQFALDKGIPVIDVYNASLMENGLVNKKYISDDFVHPSKLGIELMSKEIADYIFSNKIFPQ